MPSFQKCKNIVEAIKCIEPNHILTQCLERDGVAVNYQRNDAMFMPDGRIIFLCNTGNFNFYRGEWRVYDSCKSSLYRIKDRDERICALAKTYEFMEYLKTLPEVQQYLDNNIWYAPWAIAQHYEFATPMIDLTNEISVAAFFATHRYDKVTKQYYIVREGVGRIRWNTILPLFPASESLKPIGVQPFSRPSNQLGYGYWIDESKDYADESNIIEFEQDYEVNYRLATATAGADNKYFPDERIVRMANIIRNENVVTNKAIDAFVDDENDYINPKVSREEIVSTLEKRGIFIVDAPVTCHESFVNVGNPFVLPRRLVRKPVYMGQKL